MAPAPQPVKRRRYDSSGRQELALTRRGRILDSAQSRFLRDGYGPTTVSAIADDCGLSVDTIYKSFGGKPGLIRAIYARALRGAGPVPAERRSDELQETEPDPRRIIRGWGDFVTEIMPLGAPIVLLVRDAASNDPELRGLLQEMDADRLRRMTENAARLAAAGHLRSGLSVAEAADVLWTYSAPELYELLVIRRGMPLQRFAGFVADAMVAALL
ncbi:MAG TPA: TetR/AcrR family transcriptional regulator [Candidatus Dormibacteraeota bacterium]